MNIHLEQYPKTPCGLDMERASRVTKDLNDVTCYKCLAEIDRQTEEISNERDPEMPKAELNRMRYDRT